MDRLAVTLYQGRAGDHNGRALVGACAVAQLLAHRLSVETVVIGEPGNVLDAHWDIELAAARDDLGRLARSLDASLAQGLRPISALTRCAAALATMPVLARHRPEACVVWFDAHADLNTPETTPSGYLGGMGLAGGAGLWDSGLGAGLALSRVILVGTREVDPAEQDVIDAYGVRVVPVQDDMASALRQAIAGRPVYVHLDCDVLEPGIVPTDYAARGGLTLAQLRTACAAVGEGLCVGLEIAEFEGTWRDSGPPVSPAPLLEAIEPLLARLSPPAT